jgi:hypothetical protein
VNTLDLDVKRAAETIGWETRKAYDRLPMLQPGEFVACGPAFSLSPIGVKIGEVRSRHIGVETYFIPANARMAELIRSKIYLVQENELPDSWMRFLAHQTNFEVLDKLWRDKNEETNQSGPGWPGGFSEDVRKSLSGLRRAYNGHAMHLKLSPDYREKISSE